MKKEIVLTVGVLSSLLWGDFTLEYMMEDNMKQTIQYKDAKHVKIMTDGMGAEGSASQLIVGEKKYLVMDEGGKKRYMDMDVMMVQM
ncbi:hypothetical protein C9926_02835, partial [Sulfurovum lithotrophicum]